MRGRQPKQVSRGTEIRARLAEWKKTPSYLRTSLRALSRELSVSHQLLGHYLDGLEVWQARQDSRRTEAECEQIAKEIRDRANAEGRPMAEWEKRRVAICDEKRWRAALSAALLNDLWKMNRRAKHGPLNSTDVKVLRMYAKMACPGARELLEKCSTRYRENQKNNLPVIVRRTAKSFR